VDPPPPPLNTNDHGAQNYTYKSQLMSRLFDSLVRPILSYGCEAWVLDYGMQVHGHLEELKAETVARRKVK
jgi:hypothetical protein